MKKTYLIIYGAGKNGVKLFLSFLKTGIYVDAFCDSDLCKYEIKIYNKSIYKLDDIPYEVSQCFFFISIISEAERNEVYNELENRDVLGIQFADEFSIEETIKDRKNLYYFVKNASHKKCFLIGEEKADEIMNVARLLDIKLIYMKDSLEIVKSNSYEEDENKLYLVSTNSSISKSKFKENFKVNNLKYRIDWFYWMDFAYGENPCYSIDPCLGYVLSDSEVVKNRFGKENAKKKIFILGSSLSDATLYPFKSWAELLEEELQSNNMEVEIICYATSGYKSSTNLIELIRDILPLSPYLVICYQGYNDATQGFYCSDIKNYPFVTSFQYKSSRNLLKCGGYVSPGNNKSNKANMGRITERSDFECYLYNIRSMKSLCEEFNINFLAFLEPALCAHETLTVDEREIVLNLGLESVIEYGKKFYLQAREICEKTCGDYFIDISRIFQGIGNVFFDDCHVYECGNKIVAEKVYKELMERKLLTH